MANNSLLVRHISAADTLLLRQQVLRPGLSVEEARFSNDLDPRAGHFGVFLDNQIVAVGSVYPESYEGMPEEAWRLRGMATNPAYRSQGAGAMILRACLGHAREQGASTVWAHARTGAAEFYFRHGFRKVSDVYELPGVGPHFLMRIDF